MYVCLTLLAQAPCTWAMFGPRAPWVHLSNLDNTIQLLPKQLSMHSGLYLEEPG